MVPFCTKPAVASPALSPVKFPKSNASLLNHIESTSMFGVVPVILPFLKVSVVTLLTVDEGEASGSVATVIPLEPIVPKSKAPAEASHITEESVAGKAAGLIGTFTLKLVNVDICYKYI